MESQDEHNTIRETGKPGKKQIRIIQVRHFERLMYLKMHFLPGNLTQVTLVKRLWITTFKKLDRDYVKSRQANMHVNRRNVFHCIRGHTSVGEGELAGLLGYHGVKGGQSLRKAKWFLSISLFKLSEQERCLKSFFKLSDDCIKHFMHTI